MRFIIVIITFLFTAIFIDIVHNIFIFLNVYFIFLIFFKFNLILFLNFT